MSTNTQAPIKLQNGRLRVVVLPREGGRIASIFDKASKTEFLLQPKRPHRKPKARDLWSRFETSVCAGIDECLPSVAADGPEAPGGSISDHGDFWRLNWRETELTIRDTISLV